MTPLRLRRRWIGWAAVAAWSASMMPSLWAQTTTSMPPTPGWPERPIQLLIPYPPGGSADLLGRPLARV